MKLSSIVQNASILLPFYILATSASPAPGPWNVTSGNASSNLTSSRPPTGVVISIAEANKVIGSKFQWLEYHDKMITDLSLAGRVGHRASKKAIQRVHDQTAVLVGSMEQWYSIHDVLASNLTSLRCDSSFKAMNYAVRIDTKSSYDEFMTRMFEIVRFNQTEAPEYLRLRAWHRVTKKMRSAWAWEKYRQSLIIKVAEMLGKNCGWGPDVMKEIEQDLQHIMVMSDVDESGLDLPDLDNAEIIDDDDGEDVVEEDLVEKSAIVSEPRPFIGGIWPVPKPPGKKPKNQP